VVAAIDVEQRSATQAQRVGTLFGDRVDIDAQVRPQNRVVRFVEMHLEGDDAVLYCR
jgi:hypothetical protein